MSRDDWPEATDTSNIYEKHGGGFTNAPMLPRVEDQAILDAMARAPLSRREELNLHRRVEAAMRRERDRANKS
jgi:hypothetical protein